MECKSIIAALMLTTLSAAAATINAASASEANVATAIASASTGDTVAVPSGSATWTGGVVIPDGKHIVLQGAGIGSTVITTSAGTTVNMNQTTSRVTGFTFTMTAGSQCIYARGRGWRIDNCRFASTGSKRTCIYAPGGTGIPHPHGLIDNCEMSDVRILVNGDLSAATMEGNTIWREATGLGTDDFVVVEDCTLEIVNFTGNVLDANRGGRYVIRHCTITDALIECHSVQATHRATRAWEVYGNTFQQVNRSMWSPMFLRAGTGVIYSNVLTGTWSSPYVTFDVVRGLGPYGDGGQGDGGSLWDGNLTNGLTQPTGTHTAGTSATTLTDSTKTWTNDEFLLAIDILAPYNFSRWVYNVTDGSKGQISDNTATTVTVTLTGGTDNDWDNGDVYYITGGYPLRDQIGTGVDAALWVLDTPPYPSQALEPVYIWDQTGFSGVDVTNGDQCEFLIVEGRDYILAEHPSYTALEYPHPLRGEGDPPPPATTRRITASVVNAGTVNVGQ